MTPSARCSSTIILKIKRNEAGRYETWLEEHGLPHGDEPTEWEQNEYFDFF